MKISTLLHPLKFCLMGAFVLGAVKLNAQNVGIGEPAPQQKLDVNGAIRIGTTAAGVAGSIRYNAGIFEGYNGSSWVPFGSGNGTVTSIATGTGLTGGPITGSGTISLDNTAVTPGTYGSATTVGTFTVDAQGRITSASNSSITGVPPGGAAGGDLTGTYPNPSIANDAVTSTKILDGTIANADIANGTINLTQKVTGVLPIANGGTNTNAIGAPGSIAYSNGTSYTFTSPGVAGQALVSGGAGAPTWANVPTGTGTTNYLARWTSGTALGIGVTYDDGTNVGISTTTPVNKLQVNGSATFGNGGANVGNVGNVTLTGNPGSPVSGRMMFGTDNTGWQLRFSKNAGGAITDIMTLHDNTNVGIGLTSPAYRLDVAGGHVNVGAGYGFHTTTNDSWFPFTNGFNYFRGQTYAFTAPWYDENNTATYVDPSTLTRLNDVQWGNGFSRTQTRDNAGLRGDAGAVSGFYETSSPTNYPAGAGSWWHLLDVRHSNPANNYAMQIAGSFFDQRLYFRKTNDNAAQPWKEIATTNGSGANNYVTRWTPDGSTLGIGVIYDNGTNVGIGNTAPAQKLDVTGNARINNAFIGDVGHGATWGGFAHYNQANTTGYALISSSDGNYTLLNKQSTGGGYIGFRVGNADRAVITDAGLMGINTTAPGYRLHVNGNVFGNGVYSDNWFRSYNATGWYNETYGGGIWMQDATWVRTYGSKNFYCDQVIQSGSEMRWNNGQSVLTTDQGGSIELGACNGCGGGGNSYIDYHWGGGGSTDYNVREQITNHTQLSWYANGGSAVLGQMRVDYVPTPVSYCEGDLWIYAVYSYWRGYWLDVMNDLDAIDNIKPRTIFDKKTGRYVQEMDPNTLPDVITNKGHGQADAENGEVAVNMSSAIGLAYGGVRQLRAETKSRDEALEARIERLEKMVSQLTGKAVGEIEFTATATAYKGAQHYVVVDARITPNSVIEIKGISDFEIVKQTEGSFTIKFNAPPFEDTRFTYSAKF